MVNTGWTGGPYGTGERMNIKLTRNMVRAALNGELDGVETVTDPIFGVQVPVHVPGVPDEVLQPRGTWADPAAYDAQAQQARRDVHRELQALRGQRLRGDHRGGSQGPVDGGGSGSVLRSSVGGTGSQEGSATQRAP